MKSNVVTASVTWSIRCDYLSLYRTCFIETPPLKHASIVHYYRKGQLQTPKPKRPSANNIIMYYVCTMYPIPIPNTAYKKLQ